MSTTKPFYSSLMELNTRVLLGEIGPRATLDDLPDAPVSYTHLTLPTIYSV